MNYKEETLEVYDTFSDYFKEKFQEYTNKYIEDELAYAHETIPRHSKILDLGAGSGDHAFFFEQKGHDVLCLDISESFLDLCKNRGLKTIKMDFEQLRFPRDSFDMVWAYTSLLHIPKVRISNVLQNIHTITKAGGFFMLSLKEGKGEGFVEFDKGGKRWFSLYGKNEIEDLLKSNFLILRSWKVPTTNGKVFLDFFCKKLS